MKILLTGAAGFIGSHLADKLLAEGHEIIIVDDLSGGNMNNLAHINSSKVTMYHYDCRDTDKIEEIFKKYKPEIVYHLAANAAEGKSHFAPIDIFTRSYNSFLNVLISGIRNGMRRIVVTSSAAVYGGITPPFKETDIPEPEDLYGLAKLTMEKSLHILSKVHTFEYVIARPHNVYGPRQNMSDPYRNVVMLWMNPLLKGLPYTIYGDGSMKRCYTYVDDLVDGLYQMGFRDVSGEVFNIGADEPYSLKELSDALQKVTGGNIPPLYLPQRPQEVSNVVLDHTKAKEKLGYKTSVTFEEGIRRTWEWCKTVGTVDLVYTKLELVNDRVPKNWKV